MILSKKALTTGLTTLVLLAGCGEAEETAASESPDAPSMTMDSSMPEPESPAEAQSPQDQIADAYLREMTNIADALEQVKDETSAQEAGEVIRSAKTTMNAMTEALETDLSSGTLIQILGPRQNEFMQVQTRLSVSMTQLAVNNPDLLQTLNAELEGMPGLGN